MVNEKRFKDKLSGKVRFPEDVRSKKTLFAKAYRSPYPSGIIESITLPELPADSYVIDYKGIPGNKTFHFPQGKMPLLAHREVTYKGEPILLVGAPTKKQLFRLLEQIKVVIEPVPERPPLSLELGENVEYERHFLRGEAEKILNRDDHISDEDFFSIESQAPTTRLSAQVSCQKEGPRFIIHSVNQWSSLLKKNAASSLKIRQDQIILRNYPCENSQESRLWYTALSGCHAALLCQLSKRTVNFIIDEQENIDLTPHRGKTEIYMKGALSHEGDFMALKVDFALDVGAYGILTPELIDRMTLACTGVYQCRHVEFTGKGIRTNNVPRGFFPDLNVSQIFHAVETFTNNLIRQGGFPTYEWKFENRVRKGNLFLGNSTLGKGTPLTKIMEMLKQNSDFFRKNISYQLLNDQRENISQEQEPFRRGIALSLAYLGNDFLYNHIDLTTLTVRALLDKEGQLTLFLPVPPGMDRIKKQWALKVMDILSLKKTKDVIFQFDQERINGGPLTAGRTISHITRLIELCCDQIQKRRFRDPLPLDVTRRYSRQESRWNNDTLDGIPFYGLSWGGCTVEVEMDPATADLKIKYIHFVLDGGLIQDEPSSRVTVERGLHQAMDNSLGKDWRKRYPFPTYEVDFLSSGNSSYGIDGLVQSLFPPALAGAINQASGRKGYTLPLEEGLMSEDETK
jgi:CO/xanthine dehydrogenase Mo-binding subunit